MSNYALAHLSDQALLAELAALVAPSRATDAIMLAHLAEVDARRLYLGAACSSMHAYCLRVLHMSEDAAFKRITAARAARRFPMIFIAVADGRLHLSGVCMLAPHLTIDNVERLIAAASHRSKREIEVLLAEEAPQPDVPAGVQALPVASAAGVAQLAPGRVAEGDEERTTRATPLAPQRFALQVTIDQATHEKLVRAQALLRHRVPSGDLAEVVDRALDALLATLERERFAATERPRPGREPSADATSRAVPSEIKRAVHVRDGEQCSFVSDDGVRCAERGFLEFDHQEPVALGGASTEENVRILCAAHNQHEADRRLGREFMATQRPPRPETSTPRRRRSRARAAGPPELRGARAARPRRAPS